MPLRSYNNKAYRKMQKANKKRIYITEVSPRDGFQMETKFIPTSQKVAYINRLSSTGLTKIEVTAFSAPTAVPALADAETVLSVITRAPCVEYTALVPNQRG